MTNSFWVFPLTSDDADADADADSYYAKKNPKKRSV